MRSPAACVKQGRRRSPALRQTQFCRSPGRTRPGRHVRHDPTTVLPAHLVVVEAYRHHVLPLEAAVAHCRHVPHLAVVDGGHHYVRADSHSARQVDRSCALQLKSRRVCSYRVPGFTPVAARPIAIGISPPGPRRPVYQPPPRAALDWSPGTRREQATWSRRRQGPQLRAGVRRVSVAISRTRAAPQPSTWLRPMSC